MRAITALFTLIALLGVTSVAQARCTEKQTPAKQRVVETTRGFVPVAIIMNAPDDEEYPRVPMLQMTFAFWMKGKINLVHDKIGYLKSVHHCSLGLANAKVQKTKVIVRAGMVPELPVENATAIGSRVIIPSSVVAARPEVELTLDSGTELKGVWGERVHEGKRITTLTISKVE
ncbi:MAG: hypothetical protein KBD06_01725 [Candidatus Pacebacteria bacterium]|nr:hypothetical protein [Candidatus Paceibacterota bacterium]